MDEGTNATFQKVLLQSVSLGCEDGKDMIDVVSIVHQLGQTYCIVLYIFIICTCDGLSPLILGIKMFQFHIEYGCLNVIQSAVTPFVRSNIFLRESIIGQGTENLRKILIIGGYRSAITQSSEILAWIETMAGCIAEGAGSWES